MRVPPCVEHLITEGVTEGAAFVAAYFRQYGFTRSKVISILDEMGVPSRNPTFMIEVLKQFQNPSKDVVFSCSIIKEVFPQACEEEVCPLSSGSYLSDLEFLKSRVAEVYFDDIEGEIQVYFHGASRPFIFTLDEVVTTWGVNFKSLTIYALKHFGRAVELKRYKDPDTGEKIDHGKMFLEYLIRIAKHRGGETSMLTDALDNFIRVVPVVPRKEANPNTVAWVDKSERILAVNTTAFFQYLHKHLGIRNPKTFKKLMAEYGIVKKRMRIGRAEGGKDSRQYVYVIPDKLLKRLIGISIDDLLPPEEDVVSNSDIESLYEGGGQ